MFLLSLLVFTACEREEDPVFSYNGVEVANSSINETTDASLLSDPCIPETQPYDPSGPVVGPVGPTGPSGASGPSGPSGPTSGGYESDYSGVLSTGGGGTGTVYSGGEPGTLTAGEVHDLENWNAWQVDKADFTDFAHDWEMNADDRIEVNLVDETGAALVDARVWLIDGSKAVWRSRTDNKGTAHLYANAYGPDVDGDLDLLVFTNDLTVTIPNPMFVSEGVNESSVPVTVAKPNAADVMIAFDATGSMGDELEYIKDEVNDIFSRVSSENPDVNFRFGSVFYRDYGDQYLSVSTPLDPSIATVESFIDSQAASGGGDFPEAVHIALQEGIVEESWSESARARIMFLILDAPPHGSDCIQEQMRLLIAEGARKGIRVIPVTSSGINKETEYLMRFSAMATGGTYTFLTDHSGIGNDHIDPTTAGYVVEFLNDQMVRLVNRYVE